MSRGRGRPYRPPLDSSPWSSVAGGVAARTAWLLGTSRMLRADGAYANRQEFLPELVDRGVRTDNTRLSRWESGAGTVTPDVIAAYEDILGLPAHHLGATVELLTPGPTRPADRGVEPDARLLDGLIEAVLADGGADGRTWVALTTELAHQPGIYLRSSLWRALADALISELSRSVGVAYSSRLSALHHLIAHPMAHHEVLAAIGHYVTDPHSVRVEDIVAALAQAPSSGGRYVALGLLSSGDAELQAGAVRAITTMHATHTWTESLDAELEESVLQLLAAPDAPAGHADLLRYLSPEARERILAGLGRAWQDGHHRFAVEHATLGAPATASAIAAEVTAAAQAVAAPHIAPDTMLERLVREALFHAHADRRHRATLLLMSSPYAAGLAAAAAGHLDAEDPLVATRAARLMRACVTPQQLPHILQASADRPVEVERVALSALGHLPELEDAHVDAVVERASPWLQDDRTTAAVYVLGMHGLTEAISDPAVPGHVASACAWWRRTGPRVAS